MEGRRVYKFGGQHDLLTGEYGCWRDTWYAVTPNGHCANLADREVIEHADGTITVSPSIEVSASQDGKQVRVYQGFLERGVWREA